MVQIKIQRPSAGVLSRMRNGHAVRIHAHVSGEGLSIDVNPETYDSWTHAFKKGKAIQYAMSPDEIAGSGLKGCGAREDYFKTTAIGKAGKSSRGRKVANAITDRVIQGISTGTGLGHGLGGIDLHALNQLTGQHMGFLSHANRGLALAGLENDKIAHGLATARGQHGVGLYAQSHSHPMGSGVRTDPMSRLHEFSSIGRHGNLLGGRLPPALMSQPLSQNFQWGSRLPVQYQSIGKGIGIP